MKVNKERGQKFNNFQQTIGWGGGERESHTRKNTFATLLILLNSEFFFFRGQQRRFRRQLTTTRGETKFKFFQHFLNPLLPNKTRKQSPVFNANNLSLENLAKETQGCSPKT